MEKQTFRIKLFGLLAEQVGADEMGCTCLPNRDALMENLFEQFPAWKNQRLLLAVNHMLVNENIPLQTHDELALMPPFSGG
jgi:molybdopterin synthase sulfur carrier subunit